MSGKRISPGRILILFLILWTLSTSIRAIRGWEAEPLPDQQVSVLKIEAPWVFGNSITVAYREQTANGNAPPILLLHGNPMAGRAMKPLAAALDSNRRILSPDLAGLGFSSRNIDAYSAINQVKILKSWLDQLEIDEFHVVGYSQGGAVALELVNQIPDRVKSISIIASVGLQEYELLGNYELNQPLYRLYEACLWSAHWLLPHFGFLDDPVFEPSTARNFADTDLRRNQEILEKLETPALILHGPSDWLVPYNAAKAHARLAPHAQFEVFGKDHFALFKKTNLLAGRLDNFFVDAETGIAPTRAEFIRKKLAAQQPGQLVQASEISRQAHIWIIAMILFLAVYASEDLTCLSAGLLAAAGIIPLPAAIVSCTLGIWVSDFLLFLIGRLIGPRAFKRRFFKHKVHPSQIKTISQAFYRNGLSIVIATRFLPGSRVIAYLVAGTLKVPAFSFAIWLAIAAALWTPVFVGASYWIGEPILEYWQTHGLKIVPIAVIALIFTYALIRTGVLLLTTEGRARLRGRWHRLSKWEYWPIWAIYTPVFLYCVYLAIRYRSTTAWAQCNPGIEPLSGLAMESKSLILSKLNPSSPHMPRWALLGANESFDRRRATLLEFLQNHDLSWPIVLKPDVGQCGEGVAILSNQAEAENYLQNNTEPCILQEYVQGDEFGVFFYRFPDERKARIFSITEKRLPRLSGDGKHTLRELILGDTRAVAQADYYFRANAHRLDDIIPSGESVQLVELGTHSRGALFLDGNDFATQELAEALNRLVPSDSGIHFGRFDIRTDHLEGFKAGTEFKILELNGVSSESTDIYDPKNSLFDGSGKLCRQWHLAFQIGLANRRAGAPIPRHREIWHVIRAHRTRQYFEVHP